MRFPGTIVLTMPDGVKDIQGAAIGAELACEQPGAEYFADQVLDELVQCLNHEGTAMSALMSFASDYKRCFDEAGRGGEGQQIADKVMAVGRELFGTFKDHSMYLNGKCDYVYSGRISKKEIILVHYR
jgi:hypothetical protein